MCETVLKGWFYSRRIKSSCTVYKKLHTKLNTTCFQNLSTILLSFINIRLLRNDAFNIRLHFVINFNFLCMTHIDENHVASSK